MTSKSAARKISMQMERKIQSALSTMGAPVRQIEVVRGTIVLIQLDKAEDGEPAFNFLAPILNPCYLFFSEDPVGRKVARIAGVNMSEETRIIMPIATSRQFGLGGNQLVFKMRSGSTVSRIEGGIEINIENVLLFGS